MKIVNGYEELIGNTPLYRAKKMEKALNLKAELYFKLEKFNPAGSIKDRTALYLILDAEKRGEITDGATIIEPTSGNTGIGLAALAVARGYKAIFTMPDTMSQERIKLLKAYGAKVVLTQGKLGMQGAIDKALEIRDATPNSFIPSQFDNPSNISAHYETTAKEIDQALDGELDMIIAGIGTGGTISGIGKYFKENKKAVKIIGFEPESSPLITNKRAGAHQIQGIGANFIPKNYIEKYVDSVMTVSDQDAIDFAKLFAKTEGLFVGISSGASIALAVKLAKENAGKKIVAILPDGGEKYLSTKLCEE